MKNRKGSIDIRTVIIIILSAVIVFCIAILAALEVKRHKIPDNPSGGGIGLIVDKDAGDYVKDSKKTDDSGKKTPKAAFRSRAGRRSLCPQIR